MYSLSRLCAMVVVLAGLSVSMTGCNSNLQEMTIRAYDGEGVVPNPFGELFTDTRGQNLIDPGNPRYVSAQRRQPIYIYVDEPLIDEALLSVPDHTEQDKANPSRFVVRNSLESIQNQMKMRTKEALLRYGRFRTVPSPERADVILQPRVASLNVWGDRSKRDDATQSSRFSWDRIRGLERTGVDLLVTLVYFEPDTGIGIASSRALGRMESHRGEIVQRADSRHGSHRGHMEVENAKISEEHLPQLITRTVSAALVLSFPSVDSEFWYPEPNHAGIYAKRIGTPPPPARPEEQFEVEEFSDTAP